MGLFGKKKEGTKVSTKDMMAKMMSGEFDLNTMMFQLEQVKKMASMGGLLKLIPGASAAISQIKEKIKNGEVDRQLAILHAMTDSERAAPDTIFNAQKERIAADSKTTVRDVETLLANFKQMKVQMKNMKGFPGMGNLQ